MTPGTPHRQQWALALLSLCVLHQLLPWDWAGVLALCAAVAMPLASGFRTGLYGQRAEEAGALATALALCSLALVSPELWLKTSALVIAVTFCARAGRSVSWRGPLMVGGLGIGAPLLLGGTLAAMNADAKVALLLSLGKWPIDLATLPILAQWGALAGASVTLIRGGESESRSPGPGWALSLVALSSIIGFRMTYVALTVSLPTDLLIWSERPHLINLLKLQAGEAFYGPLERLNSYSYSPALEHLQYGLLRPFDLELSLRAHRALGLVWQLSAAWVLYRALGPRLGLGGASPGPRVALVLGLLGLLLTSLLAPFLHPDHLLMLSLCGAFWLVLREGSSTPWERALLVTIPVLATVTKLTGAGIGLGLVLAYVAERDWRRVGWLCFSGVLALSTIGLFDLTLGRFSDYAIRLQSSHPFDMGRVRASWARPELLLMAVAVVTFCLCRWRGPDSSAMRAARRTLLLTAGIGATSFLGYAKHGGRANSLVPFTIGATLCLLLVLFHGDPAFRGGSRRLPQLAAFFAVLLAVVTPRSLPAVAEQRATLRSMHQTAVGWLSASERDGRRVLTSSIAAYIEAGGRRVPEDSVSTIAEYELAARPELRAFEERVRGGYYDGVLLTASAWEQDATLRRLRPYFERSYVVIAPQELGGAWPVGIAGYVIAERRALPAQGAPATH